MFRFLAEKLRKMANYAFSVKEKKMGFSGKPECFPSSSLEAHAAKMMFLIWP